MQIDGIFLLFVMFLVVVVLGIIIKFYRDHHKDMQGVRRNSDLVVQEKISNLTEGICECPKELKRHDRLNRLFADAFDLANKNTLTKANQITEIWLALNDEDRTKHSAEATLAQLLATIQALHAVVADQCAIIERRKATVSEINSKR